MGFLPSLPSDEVMRAVLPWWTYKVMRAAHQLGVQKQAGRAVREIWRLQDAVPWMNDGVPAIIDEDGGRPSPWLDSPQPSEEDLTAFRIWQSVVVESFGVDRNWCDISREVDRITISGTNQDLHINGGYCIDGFDADGYNREGLDRDGNPRPDQAIRASKTPPWANIIKTRKW